MENRSVSIIIAAGGIATRLGSGISKQFLLLNGKPFLIHILEKFSMLENVIEVIVVTNDIKATEDILSNYKIKSFNKLEIIEGGKLRQDSVYRGFCRVSPDTDFVLIHDVARPLFNINDAKNCIKEAYKTGAAILAVPVQDTLKRAKLQGNSFFVEKNGTVDRENIYIIQTPQVYNYDLLREVYKSFKAFNKEVIVTDEAKIFELMDKQVSLVQGSKLNFKITYPEDLEIANAIFLKTERLTPCLKQ